MFNFEYLRQSCKRISEDDCVFHELVDIDNNLYVVSTDNLKFHIIIKNDNDKNFIVLSGYDEIIYININIIFVKEYGKWSIISFHNRLRLIPDCIDSIKKIDNPLQSTNPIFEVVIGNYVGLIDSNALIVSPNHEEILEELKRRICYDIKVLKNNKICLFNITDKLVENLFTFATFDSKLQKGVIDVNRGKLVLPTYFREISVLETPNSNVAYILAKGWIKKESYLFSLDGTCLLGGFLHIQIIDDDTIWVYKINENEENSCEYFVLNGEFRLKDIPDGIYADYKNSYLESEFIYTPSEDFTKRIGLNKLKQIPNEILQFDSSLYDYNNPENSEYENYDNGIPYYQEYDDPLDAFDGDEDAYNDWRL